MSVISPCHLRDEDRLAYGYAQALDDVDSVIDEQRDGG